MLKNTTFVNPLLGVGVKYEPSPRNPPSRTAPRHSLSCCAAFLTDPTPSHRPWHAKQVHPPGPVTRLDSGFALRWACCDTTASTPRQTSQLYNAHAPHAVHAKHKQTRHTHQLPRLSSHLPPSVPTPTLPVSHSEEHLLSSPLSQLPAQSPRAVCARARMCAKQHARALFPQPHAASSP